MSAVLFAAVISTLTIDGAVERAGGDYELVRFEVPAGVAELEIQHDTLTGGAVLDWGLWDPSGFRGWGGGLVDPLVVGSSAASRGYLPGPMPPGTWTVVIGKASLPGGAADYRLVITLRDAETLTPSPRQDWVDTTVATGARWYRGDFHVHTRESGDAPAQLEEVIALARSRGLDFIALSDHNTVSQHGLLAARQPTLTDLLLLRAAEVTTYGGHANAIGISSYVDHRIGLAGRTAVGLAGDVTAQGGVLSINHPALQLGDACIGCAWDHDDTPWDQVHGIELQTAAYEATIGLFTPRAIALWEAQLADGHRLAAMGGSDDHRAGMGTGVNDAPVGSPTTLVWAEELSEAGIVAGIRAGRTVVLLRGPDDPIAELFIEAGGERGMIGDTVTGARVTVEVRVTGGSGLDAMLYRNGAEAELVDLDSDDVVARFDLDTSAAGDRYHLEVLADFLPVTVTSHVYATYAPPTGGGCGCRSGGTGGGLVILILVGLGLIRHRVATR
ncbi:MAG TPA: CehA/McbA family metallohydrolase [Kofleriaceae bacterium]|nr:CehA/McbA family metallohydrolase [Kofleriaceae bacterium]